MIFGTASSYNYYWLSSQYVYNKTNKAYFGIRLVRGGNVSNGNIFYSNGDTNALTGGVRAVVIISSDIPIINLVK